MIDLGDVYPLTIEVRDSNNVPADGGSVTLTITLPDETTVTPSVVHFGTGLYKVDYTAVQVGVHKARWVVTPPNAGAYSESFVVDSADPRFLISLRDLKEQLNTTATDKDEELRVFLAAVTKVVEDHLGEAILKRTVVEDKTVRGGKLVLTWTPVASITSVVAVGGSIAWNPTTLHTSPAGVVSAPNGPALYGDVTVTYVAGDNIVQPNEGLAARIIVQHLYETQRGRLGPPRPGGMDVPTVPAGYLIPNRAAELLGTPMPGIA